MRRKATAAALSAGILVLVPGARTTPAPAQAAPAVVDRSDHSAADHPAPVLPIPPEVPVRIAPDAVAGVWSGRFAARPEHPSLSNALLAAYDRAVAAAPPECHLSVALLAAIGQVESGNLAGHHLDAQNRVVPAILGPVLDGRRFRAVTDTDAGHWDGNATWDRALGPMQFIPSSWRAVAIDLDGDGVRDPQDLDDAAGAAMVYLCAGGRDLATAEGLREAILSYNRSERYLRLVLAWKQAFDGVDLAVWGPTAAYPSWSAVLAAPADVKTSVPRSHHTSTMSPKHAVGIAAHVVTVLVPHAATAAVPDPTPDATPADPTPLDPTPTADSCPVPGPDPAPDPVPVPAPDPATPSGTPTDTDPATPAVDDPAPSPAPQPCVPVDADPPAPTATDPGATTDPTTIAAPDATTPPAG